MSHDRYEMLGHHLLVRSTSREYADQVRQLLRSWPVESTGSASPPTTNGDHPDVTFSVLVAGPSKSPTIRPLHFVYRNYTQVGRSTSYWHLFHLSGANLTGANLSGADLTGATGADFTGATTTIATTCPNGSNGPC